MNDINEIIKGKSYPYVLCIKTDGADFINGIDCSEPEKILEMRCFNEDGELRIFRSRIDEPFQAREIIDGKSPQLSIFNKDKEQWEKCKTYPDYFDEEHYLDIASVSQDGKVLTIGGGIYHLPVVGAKIIRVRYYVQYDSNGIVRKADWRLVRFQKEKEERKCQDS